MAGWLSVIPENIEKERGNAEGLLTAWSSVETNLAQPISSCVGRTAEAAIECGKAAVKIHEAMAALYTETLEFCRQTAIDFKRADSQ